MKPLYQLRWVTKQNQNCEMDCKMLLAMTKVVVNTKIVAVIFSELTTTRCPIVTK